MHPSERAAILAELCPPVLSYEPADHCVPFIFSSPHSGRIYPASFIASSRLNAQALRKSEDCYVEELFAAAAGLGAPLIAARFPRAYLDANREPYELDPALFRERLPDFANTQSLRVIGGLGTIARIVAESEEIYRDRLTLDDAFERIDRLYKPYHATLARLIEQTRRRFGIAVLIDCHSMPSINAASSGGVRPDIVLGDRFGASCDLGLTHLVRDACVAQGYHVALNRPYAGGFITEHYGKPAMHVHALQIEVNRALYMDEDTCVKTAGFEALQSSLAHILGAVFHGLANAIEPRAAAE